jgi:diguanylate cyclase (GGDEF)-like protein/PAS domain S-box-containing protein
VRLRYGLPTLFLMATLPVLLAGYLAEVRLVESRTLSTLGYGLKTSNARLRWTMNRYLRNHDHEAFETLMTIDLGRPDLEAWVLVAPDGLVLLSNRPDETGQAWDNLPYVNDVQAMALSLDSEGTAVQPAPGGNYLAAAVRLCDSGASEACGLFYRRISTTDHLSRALQPVNSKARWIAAAALSIAMLLSLLSWRWVTRRLQQVQGGLAAFAAGHRPENGAGDDSDDEIGQLSRAADQLMEMVDASEKALQEHAGQMRLFRRVFREVGEGILVTLADGTVLDVNPAFERISGFSAEALRAQKRFMALGYDHLDAADIQTILDRMEADGDWSGELQANRMDGTTYAQWANIIRLEEAAPAGRCYVFLVRDISHIKNNEAELERLSCFDELTRLPNRQMFQSRLLRDINIAGRYSRKLALLFIDIDRFKLVNDVEGHEVGDQVLMEVARRLRTAVGDTETVARLGGDEFVIILPEIRESLDAGRVAATVVGNMASPFVLPGEREIFLGASVGIAIYPVDGENVDTLLRNADTAMFRAKTSGRGVYKYFEPGMDEAQTRRIMIESGLRVSLQNREIDVHYQPRIHLDTGAISGFEALARWQHPELGSISPAEFILVAENVGLINTLSQIVLMDSCQQWQRWQATGLNPGRLAINISAREFADPGLVDFVVATVSNAGLSPEDVELEVTETALMQNPREAVHILQDLRDAGFDVLIDDFGTGYASLAYLKDFPLAGLKVDRTFIDGVAEAPKKAAIVRFTLMLAEQLGLRVVAEGVERGEDLAFLKEVGCQEVQGFLFSKPMDKEATEAWLRTWKAGQASSN